jgi:hypothetical protein
VDNLSTLWTGGSNQFFDNKFHIYIKFRVFWNNNCVKIYIEEKVWTTYPHFKLVAAINFLTINLTSHKIPSFLAQQLRKNLYQGESVDDLSTLWTGSSNQCFENKFNTYIKFWVFWNNNCVKIYIEEKVWTTYPHFELVAAINFLTINLTST